MPPPKPKYIAIYEWLSNAIENQDFKPGDKIPNEVDLAKQFNVHRMTVRQAIDKLVTDHILIRRRGKGTFILSEKRPVMVKSLGNLTTYHDDIVEAGLQPKYQTLQMQTLAAENRIAEHLRLEPGAPVVWFSRVMYASRVPLVIERTYVPHDLFPGIEFMNLDTQLYDLMREHFLITPVYADQEIGCVIPLETDAKLLRIKENIPCLELKTHSYNNDGRIVEYSVALHRGDKYRFKCSIAQFVLRNM